MDQRLFAPPHCLSQLITSFIASESQGIRHAPLLSFLIIAHTYSMWDDIYFQLLTLLFLLCTICHRSFRFSMQTYLLSNQWWRITDSNRWPSACKADALASWANPPFSLGPQKYCIQWYEQVFCKSPFQQNNARPRKWVVPGRVELPTSTLSV